MATGLYGGECIEMHSVYVFDRGGMTRIAQILDVSSVKWTRDRDGISEANIRVEGSACSAQAEMLAQIEPKRHEIVIFRGLERVWEGPVWRVGWHSDWVEINAHDCFQYIMGTPLSQDYSSAYPNVQTVADRVEGILEYELQRWETLSPPANILPYVNIHHFPTTDPKTTSSTKAFEMTVGEHIQNLAHYSGIDFACIGRSFHLWDVDRHLGRTRMLTEADFLGSEVILTAYGSDHTQNAYVVGEDGVYGFALATEYNEYYGPWTTIYSAYNEEGTDAPTQAELDSQAQRNLSGRTPVPVEVRIPDNSSIRLTDTLGINDLVPGVQIPVLATLNARRTSQMQKLDHLAVTEGSTGETVQVTLVPSTAHDPGEGEGE
jgi:hypothetical protein